MGPSRPTGSGGATYAFAMKSLKARILLIVLSLLCGVIIAELILRVLGITYPRFHRVDEHLGVALRPGARGWWVKEGKAFIEINSAGFRDREHSKDKAPNNIRIAVLGDSFAEALAVPMADTFWAVMERQLRGCDALNGRDAEVINFGVAGYGTGQELLSLRRRVWDYSPEIIVLAFFSGNDVRDNSRILEGSSTKPYFFLENGNLVLDNSFQLAILPDVRRQQSMLYKLYHTIGDYSRLLELFHEARGVFKKRAKMLPEEPEKTQIKAIRELPDPNGSYDVFDDPGIDKWVFFEPVDQAWREAWEITERSLAQIWNEVRQNSARFLVVTLTTGVQAHPDRSVRQAFMDHLGVTDLDYPDERIKAVGAREGFPVLTLAPAFRQHAERHRVFLHGFDGKGRGHWNSEGHRLAGEIIAQKLCERVA